MRVLITNKNLGFGDDAVLEEAAEYSKVFGGYIGYCNGVRAVIATEDGAIILEDECFHCGSADDVTCEECRKLRSLDLRSDAFTENAGKDKNKGDRV